MNKAIIEKAKDGGVAVYCDGIPGVYGYGENEQDAKTSFLELVHEQAEFIKNNTSNYPDWYSENIEFEYQYDLSGFFEVFPFINASQFAKAVGINQSLMRKYKSGVAFASPKQKKLIQSKYNELVSRMREVRF